MSLFKDMYACCGKPYLNHKFLSVVLLTRTTRNREYFEQTQMSTTREVDISLFPINHVKLYMSNDQKIVGTFRCLFSTNLDIRAIFCYRCRTSQRKGFPRSNSVREMDSSIRWRPPTSLLPRQECPHSEQ